MKLTATIVMLVLAASIQAQSSTDRKGVGGGCEGCEAIYEYGTKQLKAIDTLPDFASFEPKLKISGTVFKNDGRTPAPGVIIYIYHTNRKGIYEQKGNETGWGKRHGYIRGWVKTGADGKYTFYTFRPASYPSRQAPEHIHVTIKEPGVNEYWIDEYLFDDDPLLTADARKGEKGRGGNGIVKPEKSGNLYLVKRDIILGKNVPGY